MERIRRTSGFTIVELLIVVVVIAILATITIVSYNGISNQAHDTAVKSDLAALKKKVELYKAEHGTYSVPISPAITNGFKAARESYMSRPVTDHNLIYCMNIAGGVTEDYTIIAYSKSGKKFRIGKDRNVEEYGSAWVNQTTACQDSMPSYTNNYRGYAAEDTSDGPWRAWAGGN